MKYIKKYENVAKEQYWKIDGRKNVRVALLKTGLTDDYEIFDAIILDPNVALNNFYLLKGRTVENKPYWYYSFDEDQFKEIDGVVYNGEVEVTEVDVQANKYNL